ncbi:MAG: hypothetical protein V1722_02380 [Candidatus Micrarchaeota archaeon]
MAEETFLFAVLVILFLYVFNVVLPQKKPEFTSEEIPHKREVNTV